MDGSKREYSEFNRDGFWMRCDVVKDNFNQGLCLPLDTKIMGEE